MMSVMPRPENELTGLRKLNLVGSKTFAVTIPIDMIKILKWKKGDILDVRRQGNKVIIENQEGK